MKFSSLVFGSRDCQGNAKVKRALRGCEKDWNNYGEPAVKFLRGYTRHHKRKHRGDFLRKKYSFVLDKLKECGLDDRDISVII